MKTNPCERSPAKETTLKKWGNSQGVLIPKNLCEYLGIAVGDRLEMEEAHGAITMRPAERRFTALLFRELVVDVPAASGTHRVWRFGCKLGREVQKEGGASVVGDSALQATMGNG